MRARLLLNAGQLCRKYVFWGWLGALLHMSEILPLAALLIGIIPTPSVPGAPLYHLRTSMQQSLCTCLRELFVRGVRCRTGDVIPSFPRTGYRVGISMRFLGLNSPLTYTVTPSPARYRPLAPLPCFFSHMLCGGTPPPRHMFGRLGLHTERAVKADV